MSLSFSIVVNTFNRCESLKQTLRAFDNLHYRNFEVVIVNGPSTDGTDDILKEVRPRAKVVQCPEQNLAISRNLGIAWSAGDIVAFIDDDAIAHPEWLNRLLIGYADPQVAGVGGFTIDNTGKEFQVSKTICDRFGRAYIVTDFFDERPLNVMGSPYYPSLLGTNSSFRRSALLQIAGFDEAFAYFLDETDVCLRLVDAGFKIVYAPEALVYHQYAESPVRTSRRVHKTLYVTVKSKSYFVFRHGIKTSMSEANAVLEEYRADLLRSNQWHEDHGQITDRHRTSLDRDVDFGIQDGRELAFRCGANAGGALRQGEPPEAFKAFPLDAGMCIALVSRAYPPHRETGIPRWTELLAFGLAARGHQVHVVTEAHGQASSHFKEGVWVHRINANSTDRRFLSIDTDIPADMLSWSRSVHTFLQKLSSFGIQVASAPIWDLEGVAFQSDLGFPFFVSLHTTYALSKSFKEEWLNRPLFEHFHVDKVIEQERKLFQKSALLLANSHAIVEDLEIIYNGKPRGVVYHAVHGTPDPLASRTRSERNGTLRTTFVGRFEARKGFDIAIAACAKTVSRRDDVKFVFAGDELSGKNARLIEKVGGQHLFGHQNVEFVGFIDREQLNDLYAKSDVVIMPSRYESFGLVAIEAMAAGCVVVALEAGGLKEVVRNGYDGFLIEQNGQEVEQYAATLELLARDVERCRVMAVNARVSFETKFTVDRMCEMAEAAFRHAIVSWSATS